MREDQYAIHAAVEQKHWWWRARREILSDVISAFAPATRGSMRVAEVGCGTGGNLPMLSTFGRVTGAEPSELALAFMKGRFDDRVEVIQHAIPQPLPSTYDVIGMFDVLEHIDDDAGALRWAASQLDPGGILVITVPAYDFLWSAQDEAVDHKRRYSPASLAAALPAQLELVHMTCFNTILFPGIYAARLLMRALRNRSKPPQSHLGVPPEPLNWIFYRIFRLERWFIMRRSALGVSLLMVARRRSES